MSCSSNAMGAATEARSHGRHRNGRACGSNWSGINIAAMVVGFVIYWPIGLFLLLWIIVGKDVRELPNIIRDQWARIGASLGGESKVRTSDQTDNAVFNEFQQAQHERIREIKDEIKDRARRFRDFRIKAKRRADEEEFNQFMADAPAKDQA